ATDYQGPCTFANERPKGRLDFVRASCGQNKKMCAKRSSHILYNPSFRRALRSVARIDEHSNHRGSRHQALHQLKALCDQFDVEGRDASNVAARMRETWDETDFDRISADKK